MTTTETRRKKIVGECSLEIPLAILQIKIGTSQVDIQPKKDKEISNIIKVLTGGNK